MYLFIFQVIATFSSAPSPEVPKPNFELSNKKTEKYVEKVRKFAPSGSSEGKENTMAWDANKSSNCKSN